MGEKGSAKTSPSATMITKLPPPGKREEKGVAEGRERVRSRIPLK